MLTANQLRELLHYDPETGVFTWRVNVTKSRAARAGATAGVVKRCTESLSYRMIGVKGRMYRAHRLAWLYMKGEWPEDTIDHVNGDGLDNRWSNLRSATVSENQFNRKVLRNNTSGRTGVYRDGSKWTAGIWVDKRHHYLGSFDAFEDAVAARAAAEVVHHRGFSRAA